MQKNMLTEILEQPKIIERLVDRYICPENFVKNIDIDIDFNEISKIYIGASGSSRNVGNIAKYFLSDITNLPVSTDYSSEFAYKNQVLGKSDLFIAISQSGQTADTFEALKVAKKQGCKTIALTNNVNSKIHKLADFKIDILAGKEKSIAATKSFTAQLLTLYILGIFIGIKRKTLSNEFLQNFLKEINSLSVKVSELLETKTIIETISKNILNTKSLVLIGRSFNYAVAREGALKIKETCYIDANGYPSGEFLHGHLAFTDKTTPIISIIPEKESSKIYALAIKNTIEIQTKRKTPLIIIKNKENKFIEEVFENTIFIDIPNCSLYLSSILSAIALQLLAYYIAEDLGYDVDNPRSLTKAVLEE